MSPPLDPHSIPGLAELEDLFNKAQFVLNPVVALIELSSVDTDLLRDKGERCWGVGADTSRLAQEFAGAHGVSEDLAEWRGRLKEHWQSPAVQGADHLLERAIANLEREGGFAPQIGAELAQLADTLELSYLDVLGLLLAAAGAVAALAGFELAVLGLVIAVIAVPNAADPIGWVGIPLAVLSLAVAVASLVLAAGAYVIAYLAVLKPRIDELADAGRLFGQIARAENEW